MIRALHSKINITAFDTDISMEYYCLVSDLLYSEPVLRLRDWEQHKHGTRLQHCVNVSYYSFLLARKLGLDCRAVARAGLLHDLYYFGTNDEDVAGRHMRLHPQIALQNAGRLTELNDMERDIIAKHMWPIGGRPKYKETYLVSIVDKTCAAAEYFDFLRLQLKILGLATLR